MLRKLLVLAAFASGSTFAAVVQVPGGSLTVSGTSTTGSSFTYSGTLTQADTLAFTQSGNPCLQTAGTGYCTNGAGVLTVAATVGGTPVGGATSFTGPSGIIPAGTWTYGSLLLQISGVGTVQIFPTNAGNGLGSSTPPSSLTLPTTSLGALGFPAFSVTNPTLTFIIADTFFGDNGGQFVVAQAVTPPPVSTTNIPTLGPWSVVAMMLILAACGWMALRRRAR